MQATPSQSSVSSNRQPLGNAAGTADTVMKVQMPFVADGNLGDRERQLRLMMDAAPAIISYIGSDLRYRTANKTYERWFGIAPSNLVGMSVLELFGEATFAILEPYLQRVLSGETVTFETEYPGSHYGGSRTVQVTYTPDFDDRGEVQGFVVLGNDTTARKNAELLLAENLRRQGALITLGDQLRDLPDIASLSSAAMSIAGSTLRVARAGVGRVDATQEYVTIENDWTDSSVSSLKGTYRFKDFGEELGLRLERGEVIAVPDVSADPLTADASDRWKALNVSAVVNVPLIEQGRLVAILFVLDSTPRVWTEADLAFVRKLADRTWAASQRAVALQELRNSEEFTRSVLASSPDCVKIIDLQGRLVTMNEGGCRQMEIDDLATCIAQPWSDFWGEGKQVAEQSLVKARQGQTSRFEGFCPTAKGTPKWWEVIVTPVRDNTGNATRILSISRDITERRQAEQERERLTSELSRSNEDLLQFAQTVAHDLQSPLRGMACFAQLLQRNAQARLDEDDKVSLKHMVESAQHMQQLVEAILRFAQVGQGEIERKPVAMDAALDGALRGLKSHIEDEDAAILRGELPVVSGDAVQLEQLMQNLIGNAVKYRRPEERPRIRIGAMKKQDGYVFSVEDNGEGIATEHHHKIFEPLKRLHSGDIPGTGLGLATCQRIVNRHGGRIWVESKPGSGSTFYFTLAGV